MPTERRPLTRPQAARKIPVTVTMMSQTTRCAAPLALTCGLLVGLCVCWPSYTSAEGTERDPSQGQTQTEDAVAAIRLVAEQGDAAEQNNLGGMYATGRGVPQDETEAARWFRLAAEQGLAGAQRSPTSGSCMGRAAASLSKRPRIVIFGGGFGAVSAARHLERIFAGRARFFPHRQ